MPRKKEEGIEVDTRRPYRLPGEPVAEVFGVRAGLLAIYSELPAMRRIVALRFPGDLVFPTELASRFGIVALVKSAIQFGRGVDISDALDEHRHERIAHEWLLRGSLAADERVAHLFCEVNHRGGFKGHIPKTLLSQLQMAQITGQTSVNINRVLAALTAKGLIARANGTIALPGWDELVRMSGFRAEAFA